MGKIILFLLCFNLCNAQCMDDIPRYAKYTMMDVFNHDTQNYEKYKKVDRVDIMVVIDTDIKKIFFTDSLNKYFKEYFILDCQMGDSNLTYKCKDVANKQLCEFTFRMDKSLTVEYYPARPVIYRVRP